MPDLPDHVPVATARRDVRERRPRRHPEQLSLRIELIEQGVEVALVDATAVQENQRALGVARRLAIEVDQLGTPGPADRKPSGVTRGLVIGRRTGSTWSRRCS